MKIYDAIVVGGGLSGLTAAYEMLKKTKKVLIIEKEIKFGGRANTEKMKGFTIDRGAVYLMYVGKNIKKYGQELKFSNQVIPLENKKASFYYAGNFHTIDFSNYLTLIKSLISFKLINAYEKIQVKTLFFLIRCVSSFREIKKDHVNWKKFNKSSGHTILGEVFSNQTIDRVFDPVFESILLSKSKDLSSTMIYALVGSLVDSENKIYYINGGIGEIANKIFTEYRKKGEVLNDEVFSIKKNNGIFHIKCGKKNYISKTVISSIPVNDFAKIANLKRKYQEYQYRPAIVINIGLKKHIKTIPNSHLIFFSENTKHPFVYLSNLTNKNLTIAPESKALLYLLCKQDASKKYLKWSDGKIKNEILENLFQLFGDFSEEIEFIKIIKWKKALPLLDQNFFIDDEPDVEVDGLFICGDSRFIGLDGVIQSGINASEKCKLYLQNLR